jgi:hypothetical protein
MPNSWRTDCIQITFAVALASALYSASVLDLETICYFLDLQDTRFVPKKIANPLVDLLPSGHPAQSASENALSANEDDL